MIDFSTAINLIKRNGRFKPNKREDSYYRTYVMPGSRPMQVRISNHGTHLWTWYDRDFDPSCAINICIVYSDNGAHDSNENVDMSLKDKQDNIIGQRKSFAVIQFVYNCQLLDENDSILINNAVQSIWKNKGFIDPLAGTPKHAKVYELVPNQPIKTLVENKSKYINNTMNTNKKVIRLTESKLKSIIAESVKKVLTESIWYGDIKPFETILNACQDIMDKFEYVNDDDYEDQSDCDGEDLSYDIYRWAKGVRDEAEDYIRYNIQNAPIGANEGW